MPSYALIFQLSCSFVTKKMAHKLNLCLAAPSGETRTK
jgi:hypothetical protein